MKLFFAILFLAFFIIGFGLCSALPSSNVARVDLAAGGLAYYAEVSVGTPGLNIKLEVRTSYDLTLIPGIECTECQGTKYSYNASSSSTKRNCSTSCQTCLSNNTCGFNFTEKSTNSSVNGFIVQDTVSVGGLQGRPGFGNIISENGSYLLSNGILGLGKSSNGVPTLLNALNISKVFEIGLTPQSGWLVLGGYNYSKQSNSTQYLWTKMSSDEYTFSLNSIKVGSSEFSIQSDSYIDSGVQLIYLPATIITSIQQAVNTSFCKQPHNTSKTFDFICGNHSVFQDETCILSSDLDNNLETIFPALLFTIEDAGVFNLTAEHYFFNMTNGTGDYVCFGIRTSPLMTNYFGSLFIRAFQSVVFDLENNKIGFQADNSTYTGPGKNSSRIWIYIGIAFAVIMVVIVLVAVPIVFMKKFRHRHHIDHL